MRWRRWCLGESTVPGFQSVRVPFRRRTREHRWFDTHCAGQQGRGLGASWCMILPTRLEGFEGLAVLFHLLGNRHHPVLKMGVYPEHALHLSPFSRQTASMPSLHVVLCPQVKLHGSGMSVIALASHRNRDENRCGCRLFTEH